MAANDFTDRGYALNATIATDSTTATVFANTAVAITGILALALVCVSAMLTQEHRRPQDPHLTLAEGGGERPQDPQLAAVEDDGERSEP